MKVDRANQSMLVRNRAGFSLIEIVFILLIVGIAASQVMPRLFRSAPKETWSAVIGELTTYVHFVRQETLRTHKKHRLLFKEKEQNVTLEVADDRDEKGKVKFTPVGIPGTLAATYTWPKRFRLVSVGEGKKNSFEDSKGRASVNVSEIGVLSPLNLRFERESENGKEDLERRVYSIQPFLAELRLDEDVSYA